MPERKPLAPIGASLAQRDAHAARPRPPVSAAKPNPASPLGKPLPREDIAPSFAAMLVCCSTLP